MSSDIYVLTITEIYNRLVYGNTTSGQKLYGLLQNIYNGPQSGEKFSNDKLHAVQLMDLGFEEKEFTASNNELDSEYKILLRTYFRMGQDDKDSYDTYNIDGSGLITLRSKILDTIFTGTNGVKNGFVNCGVRYMQVSGNPPVLNDNQFYQDCTLKISTGLFGINGRYTA